MTRHASPEVTKMLKRLMPFPLPASARAFPGRTGGGPCLLTVTTVIPGLRDLGVSGLVTTPHGEHHDASRQETRSP